MITWDDVCNTAPIFGVMAASIAFSYSGVLMGDSPLVKNTSYQKRGSSSTKLLMLAYP